MNKQIQLDEAHLCWEDFLDQYFAIAKHDVNALAATALRTKSLSMREVLARGALVSHTSLHALEEELLRGKAVNEELVMDPTLLGELGRVILLQNLFPSDTHLGTKLLAWAHALDAASLSKRARRTLLQYYITVRDFEQAEELLDAFPDLDSHYFGYLRAEMNNPFVSGNEGSASTWLSSFNKVFQYHDLLPIALSNDTTLRPFDRLSTQKPIERRVDRSEDPLVSVVLTAYKPEEQRLYTSVFSVLDQTWQNLELIVIDDCSGEDFDSVFEKLESLDSRVRLIRLSTNQGTYAARNIGYGAANGKFIAGQDDDDWSHPQRIEHQVRFLTENPELIGCRVGALRCNESLERVRLGHHPYGQNASSLMVRREGHEAVGGFLEARKAADTEYYYRLMQVTGRKIKDLESPLSIIRLLSGSLSRADFSPGWKHSSRRSFRSSYEFWHRHAPVEELKVTRGDPPPVPIPSRFRKAPSTRKNYDVILVGDWQESGSSMDSMLDELWTLLQGERRIAVLHLESGRSLRAKDQVPLNDQIQELINERVVDEVFFDDEVVTKHLILRDPLILSFLPHGVSRISADTLLIFAGESPFKGARPWIEYLPAESDAYARAAFNAEPIWVPRDSAVRATLTDYIDRDSIHSRDWVGMANLDRRWHQRIYYRSITPVVGRYAPNYKEGSQLRDGLDKIFPLNNHLDVRLLGKREELSKILGIARFPGSWTIYDANEKQVLPFLHSLDYFLFFPATPNDHAAIREILSVLSTGVIAILPWEFEKTFGRAALYAEPDEVARLISYMHADFSRYEAHLRQSKKVLAERFSSSYFENIITESTALSQHEDLVHG